ncbi:MAG: hypothetical protein BWY72_01354 [Bacteroidetes bacterium ADurb.Bin416]|nr:MAG: hypothetical protein BWY72_01354 [Bacteroidetes bacterium ADurb.Bin416]
MDWVLAKVPFLRACEYFDIGDFKGCHPAGLASLEITSEAGAKCLSLRAFTIWQCRSQSIRWRPSSKSLSPTPNPAGGALPQLYQEGTTLQERAMERQALPVAIRACNASFLLVWCLLRSLCH